jgi:hypothetical protein
VNKGGQPHRAAIVGYYHDASKVKDDPLTETLRFYRLSNTKGPKGGL